MKKLLLLLFAGALTACATTRNIMPAIDASQIEQLALFEPMHFTRFADYGGDEHIKHSVSREAIAPLRDNIVESVPRLPEIYMLALPDGEVRDMLYDELMDYIEELQSIKPKARPTIPTPALIVDVLRANGLRYGLAVLLTTKHDFGTGFGGQNQMMIMTVGSYISAYTGSSMFYNDFPSSYGGSSAITCVIVDAQTGCVVFYGSDSKPQRGRNATRRLTKIFKGYF